ncbi:hypothetical protein BUALT_Bualt14G0080200 [Buddleja alternifolia]|uniref:At1g61320/AtMIF1 LRR domain-containing protein n=1 Tax=Buddleja alternifolia TaxID=168488 RepID=A0AAV6WHL5_9LAMI|nr:hypothetical protein BUALT_Bualt14G0080200 [Buddleja alternifolia]
METIEESMNGELQLPEVIIQHIQSYLDRRQSGQTTVLSKSWYSAWSTRPILDFDERDFESKRNAGVSGLQIAERFTVKRRFAKFVTRTMQRYHELNLKIEDFRLWIWVTDSDSASVVNEFITRALKLRVSNFSLEIGGCYWWYVLPVQVFEAKSLVKLSVSGCKIDHGVTICSNIESLSLCRVFIRDYMIRDIMLGCPLLEKLHLSECNGLSNVNLSELHNLKKFSVTKCLWVDNRSFIGNRVNVPKYGKLSCLMLEQVQIDDFFFHDFSLKFPCLEDLSLHQCYGYNNIEISSRSLKYISLIHEDELNKAKFEVSRICKFKFTGSSIPSLSFMTPSREYESYISFTFTSRDNVLGDCWFYDLKKFLTELSPSRISLSITMFLDKSKYCVGNDGGHPIPVVENLMIKIHPSAWLWSAVFDDVFWSCRPKFITFCDDDDDEYIFKTGMVLCTFLVPQASQDCSGKFSYMNDLEEVNVEFFEETLKEWQPLLPWKVFLSSSKFKENKKQFRFGLKWRAC